MGGIINNVYIAVPEQLASGVGGTWVILGSTTLTGTATSIDFSSIGGYTSYMLLIWTKDSNNVGGHTVGIRCNADTGANYRDCWIKSDGTNVTTGKHDAAASPAYHYCTAVGQNERSYSQYMISNAVAGEYKSITGYGGQTNYQWYSSNGIWVNTSDLIDQITVISTANMAANSKVILLGSI